jgi:hypothetical protein
VPVVVAALDKENGRVTIGGSFALLKSCSMGVAYDESGDANKFCRE